MKHGATVHGKSGWKFEMVAQEKLRNAFQMDWRYSVLYPTWWTDQKWKKERNMRKCLLICLAFNRFTCYSLWAVQSDNLLSGFCNFIFLFFASWWVMDDTLSVYTLLLTRIIMWCYNRKFQWNYYYTSFWISVVGC